MNQKYERALYPHVVPGKRANGSRECAPADRLSERDPGSITTGGYFSVAGAPTKYHNEGWWLWVPAFAGTTKAGGGARDRARLRYTTASLRDRRLHKARGVGAELAHDLVVIGLFDGHGLQAMLGQSQQARVRVRHQHWRMRGHDDLADRGLLHPPQQFQELNLARGRQRRFRLVEDEDALALAALLEEAQKTFAVGMREKVGRRAGAEVGKLFPVDLVEISRDRKEALGAKEPSVGDLRQPARAKRL